MATEISALPNEVSQTNNVVMQVSDKVEQNVAKYNKKSIYNRIKPRLYTSISFRGYSKPKVVLVYPLEIYSKTQNILFKMNKLNPILFLNQKTINI